MTLGIIVVVLLAVVPAVIAAVYGVRARRDMRRLRAELDAERNETLIRYAADDEVTERRQSFSGWPFAAKK